MILSYVERVESALSDLQAGKMVILMDDPDRENEGDFIMPAETITTESMNFIIRHSSGIVCLALEQTHIQHLGLSFMVPPEENTSLRGTPFTVSIDARDGITTGVSAADRVKTIQVAIQDNVSAEQLVRPGHIFPLCARPGGVFERPGHTEGAIDLVRLAGFKPAAVLCEVMNRDGTMSRGKQLFAWAKKVGIKVLSIDDIIHYRLLKEDLLTEKAETELPLDEYGSFKMSVIREKFTGQEHVVLEKPNRLVDQPLLVRIHSACLTGDLFASMRCDCHLQLHYSLQKINEEGGMLIYLNQEGRGIGLFNKIKAYALQDQGLDTIEANQKLGLPVDSRSYYVAARILKDKNIHAIRLLTNNPAKISDLQKYGFKDIQMTALPIFCNQYNKKYLDVKKNKLNHHINDQALLG